MDCPIYGNDKIYQDKYKRLALLNAQIIRCIWMDYNYISVVFFRIRKYIAWNTSLLSSCKFLYTAHKGWIYLLGMDYEIMSMASCPVWVYILFKNRCLLRSKTDAFIFKVPWKRGFKKPGFNWSNLNVSGHNIGEI